jgi:hypothetical protein
MTVPISLCRKNTPFPGYCTHENEERLHHYGFQSFYDDEGEKRRIGKGDRYCPAFTLPVLHYLDDIVSFAG